MFQCMPGALLRRRCGAAHARLKLAHTVVLAAAALMWMPRTSVAQGVKVALVPGDSIVTPGTDFVVRIEVTEPGVEFNGYEAVVTFDPSVLQFIPLAPTTLQQGSLITGACATAPFHVFRQGPDSLKITNVIMCGATRLRGPGVLYKLKFHALQPAATNVQFRRIRFTNGGTNVALVESSDAFIWIGLPSDTAPDETDAIGSRLGAYPVPFRSTTSIRVRTDAGGPQVLRVYNVSGQCVRRLQDGPFEPGTRYVIWDGRDDRGAALASGAYLVTFEAPGARLVKRVILLK